MATTNTNRPGNMENVYENRTTLAFGKIISYDDKYKTLIMQLSDGTNKSMTWATFKGAWRKKAIAVEEMATPTADFTEEEIMEEVDKMLADVEEILVPMPDEVEEEQPKTKALSKTKGDTLYLASVRDKKTKELIVIEREYARKSDFYKDLRSEGYSIRFISTKEKFDQDAAKWDAGNERSKQYHKARNAARKGGDK